MENFSEKYTFFKQNEDGVIFRSDLTVIIGSGSFGLVYLGECL